jgi:hypothetical protein
MWWNDYPQVFARERAEMQSCFPGFSFALGEHGLWTGWLPSEYHPGRGFNLEVRYTGSFPFEPPKAFVISPVIEVSPHRWRDGSLCLFAEEDASAFRSAPVLVARAKVWLWCQETWELSGGYARYRETGDVRETFDFWPSGQERH